MKASEHIAELQELISKYGDQELVYARDSEGNGFSKVGFGPSAGYFDGRNDWTNVEGEFEEVNSFCIN